MYRLGHTLISIQMLMAGINQNMIFGLCVLHSSVMTRQKKPLSPYPGATAVSLFAKADENSAPGKVIGQKHGK